MYSSEHYSRVADPPVPTSGTLPQNHHKSILVTLSHSATMNGDAHFPRKI